MLLPRRQIIRPGRRPLAFPVELDHGHPLARGLVGLWPLNEGFGPAVRDASRYRNHATSFTGTVTRPIRQRGPVLNLVSGAYVVGAVAPAYQLGTGDFTLLCWMRSTQAAQNNRWPSVVSLTVNAGFPSTRGTSIILHDSTNAGWYGDLFSSDVDYYLADGASNVADGNWHMLAVGRAGTALRVWEDGARVREVAAAAVDISNGAARPVFGQSLNLTSDLDYVGDLDDARVYSRCLSDDEIARTYHSGWDLLRPTLRRRYSSSCRWRPPAAPGRRRRRAHRPTRPRPAALGAH